jgi:L-rhamnose isomerase
MALLQPRERLAAAEENGDNFTRLALQEEMKSLPLGSVWDYYCLRNDVPVGPEWLRDVQKYDADVTGRRG